jgi:glycerol-3-phosphate acyltransferase PlsX
MQSCEVAENPEPRPSGRVIRVLADGHGGDHGAAMIVEAMAGILAGRGDIRADGMQLGICGRPEEITPLLAHRGIAGQVEIVAANDVIEMHESPSSVLRRKKDSSIHVGARMVRDGTWDAFVSAGNTGALMAVSRMLLKTLPSVDRPAIASLIPSVGGGATLFLDVGANVDCTSDHLMQFAVMGSCYMQAAHGIDAPRVGLLNIGTEDIKGTDVVKLTATTLRESSLNFIGFVEGTDLFSDAVDVVVCDGFVGNVALKTMEGTAKYLIRQLRESLTSTVMAKAGAMLARSALNRMKERTNPSAYNGAPLLGLNGIVVKSHGSADAHAYACALDAARREVEAGLIDRIAMSMQDM